MPQEVFIWTTKEGIRLKVTQMTDSHLINTSRFLDGKLLDLVAEKEVGSEMVAHLRKMPLKQVWHLLWSSLARLYSLRRRIQQCKEARRHIQAEIESRDLLQIRAN